MNAEGRLNLEWTISSLGGWVATRRCMFGTTNAVIFTDHNEIAQLSFNPVSFLHIGFELPSNPEEQHMDQNQVVVHRQGNRCGHVYLRTAGGSVKDLMKKSWF